MPEYFLVCLGKINEVIVGGNGGIEEITSRYAAEACSKEKSKF